MGLIKEALITKYCTFQGRAGRREFWWAFSFLALTYAVAFGIWVFLFFNLLHFDYHMNPSDDGGAVTFLALFAAVVVIALLIPQLALSVRRIHDFDVSGLLCLTFLVPYAGLVMQVVIGCVPGTPGPNRFGESPEPDHQESSSAPRRHLPDRDR
jgi:uncharacterized membrane protein YhaH (DUF805 family)